MSRLDSVIRRLSAQRDILNTMPERLKAMPGPILEIGLGNGRTYDHLRGLFPGREIFAFDRTLNAHPACVPDEDHLVLGEIEETLGKAKDWLPAPAALAHMDIGTPDEEVNRRVRAFLEKTLPQIMARGGLVVSDQWLRSTRLTVLPMPDTVPAGRYYLYMASGPDRA